MHESDGFGKYCRALFIKLISQHLAVRTCSVSLDDLDLSQYGLSYEKKSKYGGKEWKGSLLAFSNQRSRSTCFYCLNTPWNRFHGWWWRNLGNNIIPATISLARFSYHQIEIKINVMPREKKKGKKKKKGKFAAQFLKLKRMKMEKTVKRYTTYIYTYRTYN